jgi:hypothetical protein
MLGFTLLASAWGEGSIIPAIGKIVAWRDGCRVSSWWISVRYASRGRWKENCSVVGLGRVQHVVFELWVTGRPERSCSVRAQAGRSLPAVVIADLR